MPYNFYNPTRVLFGAGQLSWLHCQPMPGKKAMVVISEGKSVRESGALERTLQEACGVADLKMSDYGIRKDECMTLAKNARATMGGLFAWDPVPMTDEECAAIFEQSYR